MNDDNISINTILDGLPNMRAETVKFTSKIRAMDAKFYNAAFNLGSSNSHKLTAMVRKKQMEEEGNSIGLIMEELGGLDWQITAPPDRAMAIVSWNSRLMHILPRVIDGMNDVIPRAFYQKGNPSNGGYIHTYTVGLEYSPVLYVRVIKNHLAGRDAQFWNRVGMDILNVAERFNTDERSIEEENEAFLSMRFWWD